MPCSNCGGHAALGPSRSNGGDYIMVYIGDEVELTEFGLVTGKMYTFGTKKKEFWVNFQDVPGLFAGQYGEDLRSKVQ